MTRPQWLTLAMLFLANLIILGLMGWWLYPSSSAAPLPTLQATVQAPRVGTPQATPLPTTATDNVVFSFFGLGSQLAGPLPTPTATPTPLPSPTPTTVPPTVESALPFNLAATIDLPLAAQVAGVVGHRQKLPLSCESRSAADWAAFFGVTIDELEFLDQLPTSADNPNLGFVGDVHGTWGQTPPYDYGVHARPVATLLRHYGLPAVAKHGLQWFELQAEIAAGRPVIVWVTGHVDYGESYLYITNTGDSVRVAPYEHTVILTGYTQENVTILDGARTYTRPLAQFFAAWTNLDNMAIIMGR